MVATLRSWNTKRPSTPSARGRQGGGICSIAGDTVAWDHGRLGITAPGSLPWVTIALGSLGRFVGNQSAPFPVVHTPSAAREGRARPAAVRSGVDTLLLVFGLSGGSVHNMRPFWRWLLAIVVFACLAGCSSTQPYIWANRLGKLEDDSLYRIGPGDEIYVLVAEQEQLSGKFVIGPDGRYAHPIVGSVALNGLTLAEATQHLTQRLAGILQRPQVTVSLVRRRPIRVSVMGEVKTAGRFELEHDESILSAIARAGGLTEFADEDSIYVIRREPTLLRIRFRLRDLSGAEAASSRFRLADNDVIQVQ